MPKIFSINVEGEKKEKEKEGPNFVSLNKKVQSTVYPNNA